MSITLDSDVLIGTGDAKKLLGNINDSDIINLLINTVSAKFLRYTGRKVINSVECTERVRGDGRGMFYVTGLPVDTGEVVSVAVYLDGTLEETLTLAASEIIVDADRGEITRVEGIWPFSVDERNLVVTYTGGFSSVPGDVLSAALEQMRVERRRQNGEVGISSKSVEGESVQFDSSGLIQEVRHAWAPYRVRL